VLNKEQSQVVGAGALAVQSAGDVSIVQNGLSYQEVRAVALDVYKSNFYELAGEAKDIARARAEEVTDKFLAKLEVEHPGGMKNAHDPDFQYALYTVQKEYARTGDTDLGDLLVDLLVDRSKQKQRDILQIVLNESLNIAPKLTDGQLSALALIFLFRYTQNLSITNHHALGVYFDGFIHRFIPTLAKTNAAYQHLEFTGCGSANQLTSANLESILGTTYQGQFLKGFDEAEITNRGVSIGHDPRFFTACLNGHGKIQVNANSKDSLEKRFEELSVSTDDRAKILALFDHEKMSDSEIKDKCIEIRPYMKDLFDTWSASSVGSFTLTSVGMSIGHANIKRFMGEFASLSIWVN